MRLCNYWIAYKVLIYRGIWHHFNFRKTQILCLRHREQRHRLEEKSGGLARLHLAWHTDTACRQARRSVSTAVNTSTDATRWDGAWWDIVGGRWRSLHGVLPWVGATGWRSRERNTSFARPLESRGCTTDAFPWLGCTMGKQYGHGRKRTANLYHHRWLLSLSHTHWQAAHDMVELSQGRIHNGHRRIGYRQDSGAVEATTRTHLPQRWWAWHALPYFQWTALPYAAST